LNISCVVADAVAKLALIAYSCREPIFHKDPCQACGDIEVVSVGLEAFDSIVAIEFFKSGIEMFAIEEELMDPAEFQIMSPFVVD
jgi:hypothetical protein